MNIKSSQVLVEEASKENKEAEEEDVDLEE